MLLNRAADMEWTQQGIYLSATPAIEDPESWSAPQQLLDGGRWYPQVMGLEPGSGTDKLAGERARFFMGGTSEHEIVFQPRGDAAVRRSSITVRAKGKGPRAKGQGPRAKGGQGPRAKAQGRKGHPRVQK